VEVKKFAPPSPFSKPWRRPWMKRYITPVRRRSRVVYFRRLSVDISSVGIAEHCHSRPLWTRWCWAVWSAERDQSPHTAPARRRTSVARSPDAAPSSAGTGRLLARWVRTSPRTNVLPTDTTPAPTRYICIRQGAALRRF